MLQVVLVHEPFSLFKPLVAAPAPLSAEAFAALLPFRGAGFVIRLVVAKSLAIEAMAMCGEEEEAAAAESKWQVKVLFTSPHAF